MGHKITALSAQKRNPNRINIYLDEKFAFGLSRVVGAWLYVGQELSEEKIAELKLDDSFEVAYQKALHLLSYRARSEAEIRSNLYKAGVETEMIEQVIARLQHNGLIDDRRFADDWVENRAEFRPRSRRALTYELKQKGVPEETILAAVQDLDEEEMAYQAAQKKAKIFYSLEWSEFRQKMYAYLARRGFNYEIAASVAARIWREQSEESENETHSTREEVDL